VVRGGRRVSTNRSRSGLETGYTATTVMLFSDWRSPAQFCNRKRARYSGLSSLRAPAPADPDDSRAQLLRAPRADQPLSSHLGGNRRRRNCGPAGRRQQPRDCSDVRALPRPAHRAGAAQLHAHTGPPYPIVSNRVTGPYDVSVWTDPDATDDGSLAGKFWVVLQPSGSSSLPQETRVTTITPLDGPRRAAGGTDRTGGFSDLPSVRRAADRSRIKLLIRRRSAARGRR